MSNSKKISEYSFETKAIHACQSYDQCSNNELVAPIVTSNTFYQEDPTQKTVSRIIIILPNKYVWSIQKPQNQ